MTQKNENNKKRLHDSIQIASIRFDLNRIMSGRIVEDSDISWNIELLLY